MKRISFLFVWGLVVGFAQPAWALPIISLRGIGEAGGLNATSNAVFSATGPNVGIDYRDSLSGRADISNGASIRLFGVQGTQQPHSRSEIPQSTQGGRFQLFDNRSNLMLEGVLGLGELRFNGSRSDTFLFSSSDINFSRGALSDQFQHNARLSLAFSGVPTQLFETRTEYRNVLVGYNPGGVTGYEQRQTGTQQILVGTRQVQTGTERYVSGERQVVTGYNQVVTGYQQVQVGQRIISACFGAWGCFPANEFGYLLEPSKRFFLSSTPPLSGYGYEAIYENRPVVENRPIYGTELVYAERPTYASENIYETRAVYESIPIYGPNSPIYQSQSYVTNIPAGWAWDATFVGGLISAANCPCAPVPEPATTALLLTGFGTLAGLRGKRASFNRS